MRKNVEELKTATVGDRYIHGDFVLTRGVSKDVFDDWVQAGWVEQRAVFYVLSRAGSKAIHNFDGR